MRVALTHEGSIEQGSIIQVGGDGVSASDFLIEGNAISALLQIASDAPLGTRVISVNGPAPNRDLIGRMTFTVTEGTPTSVNGASPETPAAFTLGPNFPNPFNPSTQIPFELPQRAQVRVTVLDVAGRTVATPAEGDFPAGRHTVAFDASGLPSGVYLYRVEAAGQVLTRKMALVK